MIPRYLEGKEIKVRYDEGSSQQCSFYLCLRGDGLRCRICPRFLTGMKMKRRH